MKKEVKAIIEISVIIFIFIVLTYFVQNNIDFFTELIGTSVWGLVVYFLIIILAIVVAPIASIPLIPIVSNIWGWEITAIVSIIGWTVGSVLAFIIARKYGVKIVSKLISLQNIHRIEKKIPEQHLFLSVIFLRIVIPVDILSYALGLFSKIKFWPYTIATFIGVIPVTVILSIIGTIPFIYQVFALLAVGIIVLIGWIVKDRVDKKKNKK